MSEQLDATRKLAEAERERSESATRESAELQKEVEKLREQLRESSAGQAFDEVAEQVNATKVSIDVGEDLPADESVASKDTKAGAVDEVEAEAPINEKLKGLSALKARLTESGKQRLK